MMFCFITLRNSNRTLYLVSAAAAFLVITCLTGQKAIASFLSQDERQIAEALIHDFRRSCVQRVSNDGDIVEKIKEMEARSKSLQNAAVDQCFRNHMSIVSGIYFIYEKLCRTVSKSSRSVSDVMIGRQLLGVSKYQAGIRPYQAQLANCLLSVPRQAGRDFVIAPGLAALAPEVMTRAIEGIIIQDPFPASWVPFR